MNLNLVGVKNFKPIALHKIDNITNFVELFQRPIALDKNRV
jgi:hypothetical protein